MNILFVCRHNIYRSRIAEEYMKKISKHNIDSAGLIGSKGKVPKTQIISSKKYGLNIPNKSKTMNVELLNKQDLVIVVADDVPDVFDHPIYNLKGKVIRWDIKDINHNKNTQEENEEIINHIIKKCDELNKKLK